MTNEIVQDESNILEICADDGSKLHASDTLNNGLRIQIVNEDMDGWAVFDFDDRALAVKLAEKLLQWADAPRADVARRIEHIVEPYAKDAARYRWMAADPSSRASWEFCDTKEELDIRIDAAMQRDNSD